jgi:predicted transcriptional regulator
MPEYRIDTGDDDWITCNIRDDKFEGAGDPLKLERILEKFQELASHTPAQ